MSRFVLPHVALAATLLAASAAQAIEVYTAIGAPGLMLGVAHPINPQFTLRADLASAGNRSRNSTEEGIAYQGKLKSGRLAVFGDWYPMDSGFRVTAGLTSNDYQLDLDASGAGRTVKVGDGTYTLAAGDGLAVAMRFPSTTPYLGIGWGHRLGESGWRFNADLGAMLGSASVSVTPRGALAQPQAQADVAKETAQLRDQVESVKAIPQISIGISYAF
ncbi:hypothetical protein KAK06_00425 [Ideonella sp. 4Y11]|uniref:Outer membrane protein beta-barrel domain-containing protein n=1 Tax=Ideonella aquatica TaxID=2824119 RepID=A0A940YC10_9BURK|nr:hypothetical protein [Ideonella aquatica]MBQ0957408.1 hypothetical protein [Ideonella aquatica]